jgi:hypothetical protein
MIMASICWIWGAAQRERREGGERVEAWRRSVRKKGGKGGKIQVRTAEKLR